MNKTNDLKNETSSTFEARHNGKKTEDDHERGPASLLKKSELSAIFIVAGVITVIVFFFFFWSNDEKTVEVSVTPIDVQSEVLDTPVAVQSIEQRIKTIEDLLSQKDLQSENDPSLDSYNARVERVEAALAMKFDLVASRLSTLENRIAGLSGKLESSSKPPEKKVAPKKAPVAKNVAKNVPKSVVKAASVVKNSQVLHAVNKGDTLYSISKKYNTTVDKVRALNKLSSTAEIFPGDKLVVK